MAKSTLTPKQSRFIREYLIDLNATAAAKRAGYSNNKSAEVTGFRLLSNDKIAAEISKAMDKRGEKTGITAERVVRELACIAFLDIKDLFEEDGSVKLVRDMPENARRAISGLDVCELFDDEKGAQKHAIGLIKKLRNWSKIDALELLGKHLNMFNQVAGEAGDVKEELRKIGERMGVK